MEDKERSNCVTLLIHYSTFTSLCSFPGSFNPKYLLLCLALCLALAAAAVDPLRRLAASSDLSRLPHYLSLLVLNEIEMVPALAATARHHLLPSSGS